MEIAALVDALFLKDNTAAHRALTALLEESGHSDAVCACFDRFPPMLASPNAFLRIRGMQLIAANARWDTLGRTEAVLDALLAHIHDEKPIAARACIRALPQIAQAKSALAGRIQSALTNAVPFSYSESMQPLVTRDALDALAAIAALQGTAR